MIIEAIHALGPWSWIILGLVLLTAEILIPGVYLMWIGIAGLVVGGVSIPLWENASWSWQAQWFCFLVLSFLIAFLGGKLITRHDIESDEPLLNRRAEQLIGRTATLKEPILDGRGRIQLGDTLWLVEGPDLPIGTKVIVVAVNDMKLVVQGE